ncbi:hypothetical protein BaRGS_00034896, partial [Batillaria attramentaria]
MESSVIVYTRYTRQIGNDRTHVSLTWKLKLTTECVHFPELPAITLMACFEFILLLAVGAAGAASLYQELPGRRMSEQADFSDEHDLQDRDTDQGLWLGGTDMLNEGHFVWAGSRRLIRNGAGFTDWANGQPDDAGRNEDCLHLYRPYGYKWNDVPCTRHQNFACEINAVQVGGDVRSDANCCKFTATMILTCCFAECRRRIMVSLRQPLFDLLVLILYWNRLNMSTR